MKAPLVSLGALVALLGACSSPATPPRSPTNDVDPPATTTGDGEVMGADRVSPGQKLEEGIKVDSHEGVKPAAQPPAE
jgi:hypothetical protein